MPDNHHHSMDPFAGIWRPSMRHAQLPTSYKASNYVLLSCVSQLPWHAGVVLDVSLSVPASPAGNFAQGWRDEHWFDPADKDKVHALLTGDSHQLLLCRISYVQNRPYSRPASMSCAMLTMNSIDLHAAALQNLRHSQPGRPQPI